MTGTQMNGEVLTAFNRRSEQQTVKCPGATVATELVASFTPFPYTALFCTAHRGR